MGANIRVDIQSPHGGKTRMDLNPDQMERLVDILDGHGAMQDAFGVWFVSRIIPHADERPRS